MLKTITDREKTRLWLCVVVLLISAAALFSHADDLSFWSDEVWSVFHGARSIPQILLEPDTPWPFTYYLLLHGWAQIATWNDFSLHVLGVLLGLLAAALLIRAGQRLYSPAAGLIAALAFGTSSYALYFVLEVRGYGLMVLAEAAFVLIYLRWLKNPTRRRSLALVIAQAAMLYSQFILIVVIALAGFHTLITSWRRFGRWLVLAGLTGVLFLPILPQFLQGSALRANFRSAGTLPSYFLRGIESFYRAYSAHWDVWFALILGLAVVGLAVGVRRLGWQALFWLVLWGVAIPVGAFVLREHFALFTTRYLTFTMLAVFLLLGVGLAALPRRALRLVGAVAVLVLALAPWQPFDHRPAYSDSPPVRDFMRAMSERYQPGDWLVIDPLLRDQRDPVEWSYYKDLYFPSGHFQIAADGFDAGRRVWHVVRQGSEDAAIAASVQAGRLMRTFWGPWYFIATLYEAPPLALDESVQFGESLRFRGVDVVRAPAVHAGDVLDLTLWWSADQPLALDYSVSLRLIGPDGQQFVQVDGPPQADDTPGQFSAWQPGQLYLDHRRIEVPYRVPGGEYQIQLVVYQWWDNTRLPPSHAATPDQALIIERFTLLSFAVW